MRGIRGIVPNGKISGPLFAFAPVSRISDSSRYTGKIPRITRNDSFFTIEIYDRFMIDNDRVCLSYPVSLTFSKLMRRRCESARRGIKSRSRDLMRIAADLLPLRRRVS